MDPTFLIRRLFDAEIHPPEFELKVALGASSFDYVRRSCVGVRMRTICAHINLLCVGGKPFGNRFQFHFLNSCLLLKYCVKNNIFCNLPGGP